MSPVTGFNIKHNISEDFVIDANILNNNWLSTTDRGEVGFSMGFNTGNRKNNPIMFGKTSAKIIASENLITASNVAAEPITTKIRNNAL